MSPLVHVGKGKTQKGTITASQGSSKASSIARGSGEVSLGGSCTAPFCSPLLEWLQMGNRLHPMARPCKTMLCIPFSYATAMGLVHQPASKKGGGSFSHGDGNAELLFTGKKTLFQPIQAACLILGMGF